MLVRARSPRRAGTRRDASSRSAPTASPARCPSADDGERPEPARASRRAHRLASAAGSARRFTRFEGSDYRSRLIAAGMYTTTPERLLGTQFLRGDRRCRSSGSGSRASAGCAAWLVVRRADRLRSSSAGCCPTFIVNSRARKRREQIEQDAAGPDRPPRRHPRGRPQLPAVAAARRRRRSRSRSRPSCA